MLPSVRGSLSRALSFASRPRLSALAPRSGTLCASGLRRLSGPGGKRPPEFVPKGASFEQLKQSAARSREQLAGTLSAQGAGVGQVAEDHDPRQLGLVDRFERDGYAIFPQLVGSASLGFLQIVFDKFLTNRFNSERLTFDLCSQVARTDPALENTTQILWPMEIFPMFERSIYHRNALNVAQHLLGPDMAIDFDMLVTKPARSAVPTPWHQDAAYWIDMPDKRALACWIAVDDATEENGCLWYEPGAHRKPLRPHERYGVGPQSGGIRCTGSQEDAVAVELKAGDAVFHHARTPHCAGGNKTDEARRAYVIYFRPQKMIDFLRENGFGPGRLQCTHTAAEPNKQI